MTRYLVRCPSLELATEFEAPDETDAANEAAKYWEPTRTPCDLDRPLVVEVAPSFNGRPWRHYRVHREVCVTYWAEPIARWSDLVRRADEKSVPPPKGDGETP